MQTKQAPRCRQNFFPIGGRREGEEILSKRDRICPTAKNARIGETIFCVGDWVEALNKTAQTDVIFVGFKKAVDTDSHVKLLHELKSYGIPDPLFSWLYDFAANRTFSVKILDSCTAPRNAVSTVPQGNILGPLFFFNLY